MGDISCVWGGGGGGIVNTGRYVRMYVAFAGSDTPMHQSGCATHTYVCMYTVVYAVLYTSMTRHVRTVNMYVRTYVRT